MSRKLSSYLNKNSLKIAISGVQLIELHAADKLHDQIAQFFIEQDVDLLYKADRLLEMETEAHPSFVTSRITSGSFSTYQSQDADPLAALSKLLGASELGRERDEMLGYAEQAPDYLRDRKENFPPNEDGKYGKNQANLYAEGVMAFQLANRAPDFMLRFKDRFSELNTQVFLSLRTPPLVSFYKYYLGDRKPKLSDLADLTHLTYAPYCSIYVTERDLCNVLRQVKRGSNLFEGTQIENIDWLNTLR